MGEVPPFVLNLGMHRCGTSCLAGCLERCGLHLGDVRRTGRHHARGYYGIVAETPPGGRRHLPRVLERGVGAVREATYRAGRALDGVLGRGRRAIAERARQDLDPAGKGFDR